MRNIPLLFFLLCVFACGKKPANANTPIITEYKVRRSPSNTYHQEFDTLDVKKIMTDTTVTFIYSVETFEGNMRRTLRDTLNIGHTELWYHERTGRAETEFCAKREFRVGGKKFIIKKYSHSSVRYLCNIFVDDSIGIVLDKLSGPHTGEEHARLYNPELKELHGAILADTAFAKFDLPYD